MWQSCEWDVRDFAQSAERGVAYWAEDTETFDAFRGHLLARPTVPMGVPFRLSEDLLPTLPTLTHATCTVEEKDEARRNVWHFEKVGPFVSTGGYDWWSVYWNDAGRFRARLGREETKTETRKTTNTETPRITAHVSTAVDEHGRALPLPPLHVHHVHLTPSLGLHNRVELLPDCMLWGKDCLDASMLVQHHGDAQCPGENGTSCLRDDYPPGQAKQVHAPLSAFGHFNDVRAPRSPALVWSYVIGLREERDERESEQERTDPLLPLSVHAFGQPGTLLLWRLQSYVVTMPIPREACTVVVETGRTPFAGTLSRFLFHSHQAMFLASDLFVGEVEDVLRVSWRRRTFSSEEAATRLREEEILASAPPNALVCSVARSVEYVDGVAYDRRPVPSCRRPWTFARGQAITVVSYLAPLPTTAAAFEGMRESHADGRSAFPQHVSWFLEYVAADATSHYTYSWMSEQTDGMDAVATVRDTVRLSLHMGTPTGPPTLWDEIGYAWGTLGWAYLALGWQTAAVLGLWAGTLVLVARVPVRAIVAILVCLQGLLLLLLYVKRPCLYALNPRDAAALRAHDPPCHASWGSVALLFVAAPHALLAYAVASPSSSSSYRPVLL